MKPIKHILHVYQQKDACWELLKCLWWIFVTIATGLYGVDRGGVLFCCERQPVLVKNTNIQVECESILLQLMCKQLCARGGVTPLVAQLLKN